MVNLGYFAIRAKKWVLGTPYHIVKGSDIFDALINGQINYLSMTCYGVKWVRPPFIPKI